MLDGSLYMSRTVWKYSHGLLHYGLSVNPSESFALIQSRGSKCTSDIQEMELFIQIYLIQKG